MGSHANSVVSADSVLNALRTVQDPDLKRDLVSLDMIQGLEVGPGGRVSFRIVLTTPACPMKAQMEADAQAAVAALPGVTEVKIQMDAQVRGRVVPAGAPQGNLSIPGITHIVAVSSGKGGVGKSTVAANLAVALALEGARVGLMDADVYGPNQPTMLGVVGEPKLVQDPEKGESFVPPVAHGVKVMSMGFLIPHDQPLVWRGPMLHSVVNQFLHKVQWGELDYLIVDMPPGTGDIQLSLAQLVPVTGAVLVTTPQEVSLQDVRRAYAMFDKVRVPVLGVVENMSSFVCDSCEKKHFPFGQGGGVLLAKKFGIPTLAQLPFVTQVREGGDSGAPIVVSAPASQVGLELRAMARAVAQQVSIVTRRASSAGPGVEIGAF